MHLQRSCETLAKECTILIFLPPLLVLWDSGKIYFLVQKMHSISNVERSVATGAKSLNK